MPPAGSCRRRLVAGALSLVLACAAAGQEPPPPSRRWSEAGTNEIAVLSDASPKRTGALAGHLADLRRALLELAGAPGAEAPYPTRIVVFAERRDFLATLRGEDGSPPPPVVSVLDRRGRLVALGLDQRQPDLVAARALLAGDVLDQLLPAAPEWLRLGVEALFASLEDEGGSLREAAPEGAPPDPAAWPSAEVLLEPGGGGGAVDAARALVRHLAQPRSNRSAQLRRYLTLLRGGWAESLAFEESFGVPFALLYAEVRREAQRGNAPPLVLPAAGGSEDAVAHRVPHERLLVALGDLLARAAPWNTVAAELHYRAAMEAGAPQAAVLRGIATLRRLDGRLEDAWALFEDSLELAPRDPVTLTLYGWSLLEHFRFEVGTRRGWEDPAPAPVLEARSLFDRARREAAPAPHAFHGYGATYLFSTQGLEPGLDALERAHALLPAWPEILADLVLLHAHAGDAERARDLYDRRLARRAPPQLVAEVGRLLVEEELVLANRLLGRGERDAARELLHQSLENARDPDARREVEAILDQLAELESARERDALRARFNAAYEAARRHIQAGELEAARRLLAPFAADPTDPEVQATARDLLRQLEAKAPAPDH